MALGANNARTLETPVIPMDTNASTGERIMEANHSRQTALKHAVDEGKMGGIAAPHEELILEYYNDIQNT